MRTQAALIALVSLASCSTPEERQQTQLMDEIEARIELPDGALPLSKYARFYAYDDTGRVVGLYLIPHAPMPPDEGCSELQENLSPKSVDCSSLPSDPLGGVGENERRWLNRDVMPGVSDGGCGVIEVVYQPVTKIVEKASCNGVA